MVERAARYIARSDRQGLDALTPEALFDLPEVVASASAPLNLPGNFEFKQPARISARPPPPTAVGVSKYIGVYLVFFVLPSFTNGRRTAIAEI